MKYVLGEYFFHATRILYNILYNKNVHCLLFHTEDKAKLTRLLRLHTDSRSYHGSYSLEILLFSNTRCFVTIYIVISFKSESSTDA